MKYSNLLKTFSQAALVSRSQLAQLVRKRAERQARLVDPATLAEAVSENVEAERFCWWARLCIYAYGHVTPVLRSYLDERCPGFLETVHEEESKDLDEVAFWHMLREWIESHVFGRAMREGWRDALAYYTTADPGCKKAFDQWFQTKRALEDDILTEIPLYEIWRDEQLPN